MGATKAVKTRADQRVYAQDFVGMLESAERYFTQRSVAGERKSANITTLSLDTFKFRLYGVSDQFQYSSVDTLLEYWSAPYDDRLPSVVEVGPQAQRQYARSRLSEVWLCSHFLESRGERLRWTLEDSWRVYRDLFLILDTEALDLYWPKYTNREFRWRRYMGLSPLEELSHSDWIALHVTDLEVAAREYEHLLDDPRWCVPSE
jgi:hypothetical protein